MKDGGGIIKFKFSKRRRLYGGKGPMIAWTAHFVASGPEIWLHSYGKGTATSDSTSGIHKSRTYGISNALENIK